MHTRLLLGSVLAAITASSLAAHADDVHATRYELSERAYTVEASVDRGYLTLVATRTVHNSGPKSDQATFMLHLPQGAVATRLRTAAPSASGGLTWFEGELMEAEAAAKKYRELTGLGGYYPKDPALLSWRQQDTLALQVFPVPAGADKIVEYTLRLPLRYDAGAYRAELPKLETAERAASVRFSAVHAEDALTVNGVAPTGAVSASRPLEIALVPRGVAKVSGAFASVAVGPKKHLVHGLVAAAPRLSSAPKGAHVVVLLDASRSMRAPAAAIAAVRAYLSHLPDATVELLTFDRNVVSPFGGRLPVGDVLSRLHAFAPSLRNGSRADDALARADAILASSPSPSRRVLLLTDTLMRGELSPERLGAMPWRSGAVLHVATVSEAHDAALARDDASPWRKLPRRTGGLFWEAQCPRSVDVATRGTFEEWARPLRIDNLVVRGLTGEPAAPPSLAEGEAFEHMVVADGPTRGVAVLGELWSRPVTFAFSPTEPENKRWAGLVFGTPLYSSFEESEQMTLAMRGRVVSPVTSFLAIEPGVRPSNEGLDWGAEGRGAGGGGSGAGIGLGTIGTLGHGSTFDHRGWLEARLRQAAVSCGLSGVGLRMKVESTLDEIVHVHAATGGTAAQRACVEAKMWGVTLSSEFSFPRAVWDLAGPPA